MKFQLLLALILAPLASSFVRQPALQQLYQQHSTPSQLFAEEPTDDNKKKKKTGGIETNVRSKLLAESIAPWRTLRLFLYGALGSGAALGGFITASGVAAALAKGTEVDMQPEYINLAIDFGAVAVFALAFKFDIEKQGELTTKVEDKMARKRTQSAKAKAMRERETLLLNKLKLEIQVDAVGTTQEAPVSAIQSGAKQHMIIVAGPRRACKEALVGANLLKMDFSMSNVLVVPYRTDGILTEGVKPDGTGFGAADPNKLEKQPFVAQPVGEGWDEYVKEEMKDALEQSPKENPEEVGIAIVVASNGKVIRRGIGNVPWRKMVDELNESVGGEKNTGVVDSLFG